MKDKCVLCEDLEEGEKTNFAIKKHNTNVDKFVCEHCFDTIGELYAENSDLMTYEQAMECAATEASDRLDGC